MLLSVVNLFVMSFLVQNRDNITQLKLQQQQQQLKGPKYKGHMTNQAYNQNSDLNKLNREGKSKAVWDTKTEANISRTPWMV